MNNQQIETEETQIDLWEIFYALKKRLWIIIAALVVGGMAMGIYTAFWITPMYRSTSMIYILSTNTTISVADLQFGTQLTGDYTVLIKSRPVLEEVIENLGLNMSYEGLRGAISLENPSGTRFLKISVTSAVPETAKKLADEIALVSAKKFSEFMGTEEANLVEQGVVPSSPISPNMKRNCMMGCIAGAVLAAAVIIFLNMLDDSIKSEDDITKYLQLTTLGVIPDKKKGRRKKNGKKKAEAEVSNHG